MGETGKACHPNGSLAAIDLLRPCSAAFIRAAMPEIEEYSFSQKGLPMSTAGPTGWGQFEEAALVTASRATESG